MALQIRRGTNSERLSTRLEQGEISWTTDTLKLYVGDGTTMGGRNALQSTAGVGLSWNPTTQELDFDVQTLELTTSAVAEATNLYFTPNRAKDAIGPMLQNATTTGISFTYNDVSHTISAVVSRETVEDDIAPLFVQGTHAGISFAYSDNGPDTIGTINATLNTEYLEDIAGTLINNGTRSGITVAYVDNGNGTGGINFAVTGLTAPNGLAISGASIISSAPLPEVGALGTVNSPTYIGSTTVPNTLVLNASQQIGVFTGITGGVQAPAVTIRASRGTLTAPLVVQPGDAIGLIQGRAYDGANWVDIGGFGLITDPFTTIETNDIAGTFGVLLVKKGGVGTADMLFTSAGVLSAPVMQVGQFTTEARDAIPSPTIGMIVYNTQTNMFEGYKNTGWASLG